MASNTSLLKGTSGKNGTEQNLLILVLNNASIKLSLSRYQYQTREAAFNFKTPIHGSGLRIVGLYVKKRFFDCLIYGYFTGGSVVEQVEQGHASSSVFNTGEGK